MSNKPVFASFTFEFYFSFQMNTHPVRIAMLLKEYPELLANLPKVSQIVELMSDREFKNRRDVNEVLSLKYHMIHYILKDIIKQVRTSMEGMLSIRIFE